MTLDCFGIASLYSSFCSSSFLNLIIDGLRFDNKLFSANKFANASALFCLLGKSLFSNLIGYLLTCIHFSFLYLFPYFIHVFRFQYFAFTEFSPMRLFGCHYYSVAFLHFSYSQSFRLFYSLTIS